MKTGIQSLKINNPGFVLHQGMTFRVNEFLIDHTWDIKKLDTQLLSIILIGYNLADNFDFQFDNTLSFSYNSLDDCSNPV